MDVTMSDDTDSQRPATNTNDGANGQSALTQEQNEVDQAGPNIPRHNIARPLTSDILRKRMAILQRERETKLAQRTDSKSKVAKPLSKQSSKSATKPTTRSHLAQPGETHMTRQEYLNKLAALKARGQANATTSVPNHLSDKAHTSPEYSTAPTISNSDAKSSQQHMKLIAQRQREDLQQRAVTEKFSHIKLEEGSRHNSKKTNVASSQLVFVGMNGERVLDDPTAHPTGAGTAEKVKSEAAAQPSETKWE